MTLAISLLFASNAAAHVGSYRQLVANDRPNRTGVLVFVVINAALAVLVGLDLAWVKWLALIFPLLGGLGLSAATIVPGEGTPIDFVILGLDMVIVAVVLFGLIL